MIPYICGNLASYPFLWPRSPVPQIMWQMIAGVSPDEPPQASLMAFVKPDGTQHQFWTYGGLMEAETAETVNHDLALRQLVCWCMGKSFSANLIQDQSAGPRVADLSLASPGGSETYGSRSAVSAALRTVDTLLTGGVL